MQKTDIAVQQKNYQKFISSAAWAEKKLQFRLTRDWPICFKCGAWDVPMDVHHLTYARFGGDELMEDLEYVCRPCHDEIHRYKRRKKAVSGSKPNTGKAARRRRYKQRKRQAKAGRAERVKKYLATLQNNPQ